MPNLGFLQPSLKSVGLRNRVNFDKTTKDIIISKQMNKNSLALLLVINILIQIHAFTVNNEIACIDEKLRANKSPAYVQETTDFTDDVYEIGNSALWITTNGVESLYELILLRNGNTFKVHAIGSDLSIVNQTYTSTSTTQLLDVVDHIIFVKEYTSGLTSFNFAAYFFDSSNLASTTLKRVTINAPSYSTSDKRFNLKFNKVLSYDDTSKTLYIVMTNSGYAEIQYKVLNSNGAFDGQIPIADSQVSIAIGNSKLLFDDLKKYYRFATAGNNFEVISAKNATAGTFGPVIYSEVQHYRLMKETIAIVSYEGTSDNIVSSFGIFNNDQLISQGNDNSKTGTYTPIVHHNKYNFIFISENLFSFSRYNSKLIFSNSSLSTLTVEELNEAKKDFKSGLRVAFNAEKQFILSDKNIIIYEISYKTDGTAVSKMNKLAQLQLSSEVSGLISDNSSKWIKLRIKCSCSRVLVTKLKCFSNKFKCLGINSYIADDCSTPYVDNVAEFASA